MKTDEATIPREHHNEKNTPVRTRFAPSPTGELHIGGARTALFNYLLAKKTGGQFVLRVEDTDQQRNQAEFIHQQYQDLVWLGCEPDESPFKIGSYGPYQQSQRLAIYQKYLQQLLVVKKAYHCFCSAAELAQEKFEFQKSGRRNYQYSRKCLKLTDAEVNSLLQSQQNYVIRFQVNQRKNYQLIDLVRGPVNFPGSDIEDFVLCRSNGVPLLNFAVVVDDHTMQISHILRGEEHLPNTAKQLVLYEALGWTSPQFGHLSLILNQERKKLSKRDQETSQFQLIRQLREAGYLPDAVVNYLLFLGWHPGNTREIFSPKEAILEFNLAGLHARGAVYSKEKLNWYNQHYIQKLTDGEFAEYSWPVLKKAYELSQEQKDWTLRIAGLFRSQLNYFQELVALTDFFFQEPPSPVIFEEKELSWLKQLQKQLSQLPKWELEDIKLGLQSVCLDNQAPKKEFYSLIRKLLTGKQRGPELPQIIFLLGKKLVEKRLSKDFRGFFPILREQKSLVYLDNAATSLKPETVIQAVTDYYQKCSINSHSESNNPWFQQVWETTQQTRQLVAKKIAAQAEEIIFVPSATYALNILALSLCDYLTSGDKIALTHLEHSSNLYPWQAAAQSQAAEIVFLPLTKDFVINIDQLPNYINHQTKIVSFFHLSNSLGTINPVAEITRQIKKINPECLVIVDACQSIIHVPVDVATWNIDALIFSGHKIYGPIGIGILWLKKALAAKLPHLLWGGGKKNSPDEKITPLDLFLPQKFEVGTLPLAQIFGLRASLEFVNKLNLAEINHHETQLRNYALHQLNQIPSLIIYNQKQFSPTIITFNLAGCHAHDVADYLGKKNILLRAGDFCCPYLAEVIGVNSALRISLDIHNNQDDIDRLIDCLQEIVNNPQVLVPFG